MEDNSKYMTEQVENRLPVVLIDDSESDFNTIKTLLYGLGYSLINDYSSVRRLIANYNGYRTVSETEADDFKDCVLNQVGELINNENIIWILDVCWIVPPSEESPIDRYGIEFMREFKLRKPILISLSPIDAYNHHIAGVKFICKNNSAGESMTSLFTSELKSALSYYQQNSIDVQSYNYNSE